MVELVGNIIDLLFNPWLLEPIFELIKEQKSEGITIEDVLKRLGVTSERYIAGSSRKGINTIIDTVKFLSIIGLIKRMDNNKSYVINHERIPEWYTNYASELECPFKLLVLYAIKETSKKKKLKKEEAVLWVYEWLMENLTKEEEQKDYSWFVAQDTEQVNSFKEWLRHNGYPLEWNPNKAVHWIDFGSWVGFCGNHIKVNKQDMANVIFSEQLLFDFIQLYYYQSHLYITKEDLIPISNFLAWIDKNFINLPESTKSRRRIPLNLVNAFYKLESPDMFTEKAIETKKKRINLVRTGDSINFIFESRLYEGKGFEANQIKLEWIEG